MRACQKRVDRYPGHARTGLESEQMVQAALPCVCRWLSPLVIAVDWSAASLGGTFVEWRASVVWLGPERVPARLPGGPAWQPQGRGGTVEVVGGLDTGRDAGHRGDLRGLWHEGALSGRTLVRVDAD